MNKIKFTEQEKLNIKEAVQKVEKTTSGEIVLVHTKSSYNYPIPAILATLISSLFFILTINLLAYFWLLPFKFNLLIFSLYLILFMAIVYFCVNFIKPIKRLFLRKKIKEFHVHLKAKDTFLNEEIFNTKERTGILIFISEFEHMVEIIADSGINKNITNQNKLDIVNYILNGIKSNKLSEGIISAVHHYGSLLVKAGYTIKPNDENELQNDIRTDRCLL